MPTREERQEQVLSSLQATDGWITGAELGARVGASARSVRDYVRRINGRHGVELVVSGQEGYRLNHGEYRRYREAAANSRNSDRRESRLYTVIRRMIANPSGIDVFELADDLFVSPSTLETDFGRARELVREYGLTLSRERDIVRIEGAERQQRRLLRFLLFSAGSGVLTHGLTTLDDPKRRATLRRLRSCVRPVLSQFKLEVNEYALNDLLVHLIIAAERISEGHDLGGTPDAEALARAPLKEAVSGLAQAVEEALGVTLPGSELTALHSLLLTHSTAFEAQSRDELRAGLPISVTRSALRDISNQFGLDMYDEATVTRLALHVKNLIARCRLDQSLSTPLGISFRARLPFIHELALIVAQHIEAFAGITISDGEIDFLAFHIGNQVQRQARQGPPVTITCVVPQYGSLHDDIREFLSLALTGQAVIEDVVTSVVDDWTRITSDLVVSVVDLPPELPVPVVRVSPFITEDELNSVIARVRRERSRIRQDKLRATVVSLLDPALFRHNSAVPGKNEAIHELSKALEDERYVGANFEADVLDRENRSPTAFGGQFAIPHSLYMDAAKTGIAVMLLDEGIPWGASAAVRIVLLFAISPDGRSAFRDVLDELTRVLNDQKNLGVVINSSTDHNTFVRALSELLSQ
jgi:lichenan operon transcriptional antiterminator